MCAGDQSLPGGLTALIKQGEREKGEKREGWMEREIKRVECTSLKEEKDL